MMNVTKLNGSLLIAMPALEDPNFWRTVILLGSHSLEDGAFGLVVNRPSEITLDAVLPQLGITEKPSRVPTVLAGGPVQPEQGFVLVQGLSPMPSEHDINDPHFTISGRSELLEALTIGSLDRPFHLCLGYAGWAPGQLENEIEQNSWLVAPATDILVFKTPPEDRWHDALASIGVDPGTLVDIGAAEPS
jgi:putative transcriptional regulator